MAESWSQKAKSRQTEPAIRRNPKQFGDSDADCVELKKLNAAHTKLEKDSFHESMALLMLLSKQDIKQRLQYIPSSLLKKFLGEMESTYVWMERAAGHKKTEPGMKNLLEKIVIPRAKYLVNAIHETLNNYQRSTQTDEEGNLINSGLRRHSGAAIKSRR
tara:strand:+ start:53595 stop:54074 length:480 start_codon:yes stop_codon:yes gene_type:complete